MKAYTAPRLWNRVKNKISTLFPPDELSQIARKVKFIQRNTSLLQAKDFVELMTVVSHDPRIMSLERLCSTLRTLNPEADLTPQSLMERINQPASATFLKSIFFNTLEKALVDIVERIPPKLLRAFKNVYLEDCTECALNEELQEAFKGSSGGASTSSVKIDFIYEVTRKNIFSAELTDRRSPDQILAKKHLDIIQEGDLWIRDLGFFCAIVLKVIIQTGAFFLSRLHASAYVYLNENDSEQVDLAEHLNRHYLNDSVIDLQVFVTAEKIPCRLIAYRAPREIAEKRRRESNAEAKKKGRTRKQANINRLDFTFFITNVPKDIWKPEVVGTIYTVRWQIELIFKNWKTSLQIHYLKGTNADRIRCLLYGKLITIVLMHIIYKVADWYAQKKGREISLHKVVSWLKVDNKIASIILQGFSWGLFITLEMEIPKTMCKNKRKRKTTESAIKEGVHYCDLYTNLHVDLPCEIIENQEVKVA
jgi:hypothetical protein